MVYERKFQVKGLEAKRQGITKNYIQTSVNWIHLEINHNRIMKQYYDVSCVKWLIHKEREREC